MVDIISKNLYSKEELDILLKAKQIISSKKRSYLRDIIKADTGYEIIPMSEDLKNYLDKQCKSFIQSFNQNIINNTHSRFGWLVENEFKELKKKYNNLELFNNELKKMNNDSENKYNILDQKFQKYKKNLQYFKNFRK